MSLARNQGGENETTTERVRGRSASEAGAPEARSGCVIRVDQGHLQHERWMRRDGKHAGVRVAVAPAAEQPPDGHENHLDTHEPCANPNDTPGAKSRASLPRDSLGADRK